jgi:hypothetical protein
MRKTAVEWLIDMLVKENELTLKGENYKLAHPCSSHAFFITFQKYIQNIAKKR